MGVVVDYTCTSEMMLVVVVRVVGCGRGTRVYM